MSLGNSFFSDFGASGGKDGAQGVQGLQGAQGLQGNRGIQGVLGNRGGLGSQGTQGINGQIGSQGIQGGSGVNGSQGIQGFGGAIGAQGVQGAQGVGSQGVQGILGNSWTNFQSIPLVSGQTMSNSNGIFGAGTTLSAGTNTIWLFPCVFRQSFITSSVNMTSTDTGTAGRLFRILIYSHGTSGANQGYPETKLYESPDLDLSTSGVKTGIVNLTFYAGVTYWFGGYQNLAGLVFALSSVNWSTLNVFSASRNGIIGSYTYGSAPTTWNVATQTIFASASIRIGLNIQTIL